MARIEREIFIQAPVEQVFEPVYHPEQQPEWLAGMVKVYDVSSEPITVGSTYKFAYQMSGVKLQGTSTFVELVPLKRCVVRSEGAINSTWTWTYEPQAEGTLLKCTVEYTIPGSTLGRIADKLIIERANTNNLEQTLHNLKQRIEGR